MYKAIIILVLVSVFFFLVGKIQKEVKKGLLPLETLLVESGE